MKIKMTIAERAMTRLALGLHMKLVETAKKATAKALVDALTLAGKEALIDEAFKVTPSSQATNELWDVTDSTRMEYRDALYLLGQEVSKVRTKEIERGIDTQSSDTRLEEIRTLLSALGDQRDLFAAGDDDDEGDKGQLDIEGDGERDYEKGATISFNGGPKIPASAFRKHVEKRTGKKL